MMTYDDDNDQNNGGSDNDKVMMTANIIIIIIRYCHSLQCISQLSTHIHSTCWSDSIFTLIFTSFIISVPDDSDDNYDDVYYDWNNDCDTYECDDEHRDNDDCDS